MSGIDNGINSSNTVQPSGLNPGGVFPSENSNNGRLFTSSLQSVGTKKYAKADPKGLYQSILAEIGLHSNNGKVLYPDNGLEHYEQRGGYAKTLSVNGFIRAFVAQYGFVKSDESALKILIKDHVDKVMSAIGLEGDYARNTVVGWFKKIIDCIEGDLQPTIRSAKGVHNGLSYFPEPASLAKSAPSNKKLKQGNIEILLSGLAPKEEKDLDAVMLAQDIKAAIESNNYSQALKESIINKVRGAVWLFGSLRPHNINSPSDSIDCMRKILAKFVFPKSAEAKERSEYNNDKVNELLSRIISLTGKRSFGPEKSLKHFFDELGGSYTKPDRRNSSEYFLELLRGMLASDINNSLKNKTTIATSRL